MLIHAWNKQADRSHAFSDALKAIFEALLATNCSLHLFRIPSAQNPADPTSQSLSLTDSCLSDACWERLRVVFGGTNGHSVDLMALPSNAMYDFTGAKLPFFSPHRTQVAMELTCLVSHPTFTHLSFHPNTTFFRASVSLQMFSVSCFPFASSSLWWFRTFSLVGFDERSLPIVLNPVSFLHERVRLVLYAHPLRADFRISGLCLGICRRLVSTLSKNS